MNKTQLIEALAKKNSTTKKDADLAVNAILDVMVDALKGGEKIQLIGFGTFEVKQRAQRQGRNPLTGKAMTIPASKHVSFSAGKALKDSVNKKK